MKIRILLAILLAAMLPCVALAEDDPEAVPLDELTWVEDGDAPDEAPASADDGLLVEEQSFRTLSQGMEGEDVRLMQIRLTELEYYSGDISGSFGANTRAAVEAFQADFGVEITGVADASLQSTMFATVYRPLRFGSQGELVKKLQTALMQLGYYTGKISGNYLESTREAVEQFQSRNALGVTGEANAATQTALYSGKPRGKNDAALPTITPPPVSDTFVVSDAEEVMLDDEPAVPFVKQLKYEDSDKSDGSPILALQERLTALGYYSGPISGNFLGNTRNAVKAFQKQNGLTVDGIVGEATWNALFNDPAVVLPGDTPKPTATPEPPAFHILVDVNNQVTTVYGRDEAGDYTIVVRQMLCSTGTKSNPSDPGDWTLNGKTARWCYFPKWGGYAQYWTRINRSIAFHSVIYNTVNTMDLSVSSYNNLGKRASHGCIRLTVADAKWIYDNCGAGTVVTIDEHLPADPELRASLKLPGLNRSNMLPYATEQPTAEPRYVSGAQPPLPLQKLKKNDSSEAVFWLQSKLRELGYYGGKVTGTYLDGTVNAVKAFQKDHGLTANGTADVGTLEALYAQELATPTPPPTDTPTPELIAAPETPVPSEAADNAE